MGGWPLLIPVVLVLAGMAILGNVALHTDPVDLQEPPTIPEAVITFNNFRPANGDIIGLGAQVVSVQIASNSAVVSATITLDGNVLETTFSGTSPMTQTATANTPGLTLGPHSARINAVTESGDRKSSQWRFNVDRAQLHQRRRRSQVQSLRWSRPPKGLWTPLACGPLRMAWCRQERERSL